MTFRFLFDETLRLRPSGLTPLSLLFALSWGACSNSSGGDNEGDGGSSATGADGGTASGGVLEGGDGDGVGGSTPSEGEPWEDRASGVFVHLFEWPWPDVAQECENVLGPAGYSAVQVSPPGEHAKIAGRPWWERYQPVSYQLVSRSGTEAEFLDMVERCAAVGVDIYVDAVINHMSAQGNGTGTAGTTYVKYDFPGTWTEADFHLPACEIQGSDYQNDATAVRECELVGLADLDTSAAPVRKGLADYLTKLVDMGVRGFRIDAAKHMAPEDIGGVLSLVRDNTDAPPYVFLEVIDPGGEAISEAEYASISLGEGKVVGTTEFRFLNVGDAFRSKNLTALATLSASTEGLMDSGRAVVFTDNHDTQRHTTISYREGRLHELANVFLLGFPYGYPKVMSSFSFTLPGGDSDSPPHENGDSIGPHDPAGSPCVVGEDGIFDTNAFASLEDGRWVCEHRSRALRAMVQFRKLTSGTPVVHVATSAPTNIAFAREGKGFLAFNLDEMALQTNLQTGLPEGDYCNLLTSTDARECDTQEQIQVNSDGTTALTIPSQAAVVLSVGAD